MLYDSKKTSQNNKSSLDTRMRSYSSDKSTSKENTKLWSDENRTDENSYSKFLKDKQNVSEVISPYLEKKGGKKLEKLVDFNTSYGVLSIGIDSRKEKEELILTILPKSENGKINVQEKDPFDNDTYLDDVDEDFDDFELSDCSFVYDFKSDKVDRIDKDESENELDEEDELLYKDDFEEEKIEYLSEKKSGINKGNSKLQEEIESTKDIKEQKKKENIEFFEEIKKIILAIGKGKIKRIVESDEAIKRRDRIYKISDNYLLIEELRLLLKKIKEKELDEDFVQKIESIDLKILLKEQLKELIMKLKSLDNCSKS